jgi:CheY-like chemotaxis protein
MPSAFIVDDHRETAELVAELLASLGYETTISLGPLQALESLAGPAPAPDVILLDLHLQGLEGDEVCRYIRRDPHLAHVPVLAISFDTQPALLERARAAGADDFLPKPIQADSLAAALERAALQRATRRRSDKRLDILRQWHPPASA